MFEFEIKYLKYAGRSQNKTSQDFGKIIQYKVLTIITSARANFLLRSLLREIMSLETAPEMSQHIFILGKGDESENVTISNELKKEIDEYGDIIIGNFTDDYAHLSMKTLTAWIDENIENAALGSKPFVSCFSTNGNNVSSILNSRVIWKQRKELKTIRQ